LVHGKRSAELRSHLGEIVGEIASLVDQIDQVAPDHAADRIGDRKRELLGEMIDQRDLGGYESLEIVIDIGVAAGSNTGPLRVAWQTVGISAPCFPPRV